MEFVLRRSLETEQARLPGLHPENKQKRTDKPTAERILKAFADISLTMIKTAAGEGILRRLGLGAALYSMSSLKFRELEPDGANGEFYRTF